MKTLFIKTNFFYHFIKTQLFKTIIKKKKFQFKHNFYHFKAYHNDLTLCVNFSTPLHFFIPSQFRLIFRYDSCACLECPDRQEAEYKSNQIQEHDFII